MKQNLIAILGLSLGIMSGISAVAQDLPMPSPECETEQMIGLAEAEISYYRPSMKGRTIFGDLVPYDAIWRTGANVSPMLELSEDVTINGTAAPAGTYTILTIPGKEKWTIIISKQEGLRGTGSYTQEQDLVRFDATPVALSTPVETFTMDFSDLTTNSANLNIYWETTKVSFPIVHDYMEVALENISKSLATADGALSTYESAAEFYIDNNMEADKALELAKKSVDMKATFWNVYTLSRAYANKGMYDEAIKTAEKSLKLSEEAQYQPYVKMNQANIEAWSKMK